MHPRRPRLYAAAVIEFRLSLQALGQTRFAYSPLAEVASSLRALGDSEQVGPVLRPWLREVSKDLHSIDFDVLRAAAPAGPLAPNFLFMWSTDPRTTIHQQLERLLELPDEVVRHDLSEIWNGRTVPSAAAQMMCGGSAVRRRLTQAIREYWELALEPYWLRMRAVLDDDVSYRATQAINGGLHDLLSDLHPDVTLTRGVLQVNKPHLPDASYAEAELTLLPSIFVWPRLLIGHDTPGHFEVHYAARGVARAFESDTEVEVGDALAALLGRTRAAILARLAVPLSTTQLSRQLGQTPGTISPHLSVLRQSGLLTSWRSGRSVLYRRTPLASSIVAINQSEALDCELA